MAARCSDPGDNTRPTVRSDCVQCGTYCRHLNSQQPQPVIMAGNAMTMTFDYQCTVALPVSNGSICPCCRLRLPVRSPHPQGHDIKQGMFGRPRGVIAHVRCPNDGRWPQISAWSCREAACTARVEACGWCSLRVAVSEEVAILLTTTSPPHTSTQTRTPPVAWTRAEPPLCDMNQTSSLEHATLFRSSRHHRLEAGIRTHKWQLSANLVGSHSVFAALTEKGASMKTTGMSPVKVAGAVPLTDVLLNKAGSGDVKSMDSDTVEPYLRKSLQWRFARMDGTILNAASVPDLSITVFSARVDPAESDDDLPSWSDFREMKAVTVARPEGYERLSQHCPKNAICIDMYDGMNRPSLLRAENIHNALHAFLEKHLIIFVQALLQQSPVVYTRPAPNKLIYTMVGSIPLPASQGPRIPRIAPLTPTAENVPPFLPPPQRR
ncbi:hypothetical protein DOTSEDRAFT_81246 [Dothistroma septosporum NZE10]|uniref:Tyrosinase C-terminal domain-containing protein n=1 Tax=Dothistroma septosporum (strain NZE10 / CBS 128990) TaxID=675120 RepID=N1PLA2_DOTSN|nr:hypothetical protein DOTSEDRAFT_81246 [Dothistroma septosporum NZE10]